MMLTPQEIIQAVEKRGVHVDPEWYVDKTGRLFMDVHKHYARIEPIDVTGPPVSLKPTSYQEYTIAEHYEIQCNHISGMTAGELAERIQHHLDQLFIDGG